MNSDHCSWRMKKSSGFFFMFHSCLPELAPSFQKDTTSNRMNTPQNDERDCGGTGKTKEFDRPKQPNNAVPTKSTAAPEGRE